MPETLVINASPLIFLGNAGQLDLLRAGGAARFVVPSSVLDEVTRHADQAARSLAEARWIDALPLSQFRTKSRRGTWDPASRQSSHRICTSMARGPCLMISPPENVRARSGCAS